MMNESNNVTSQVGHAAANGSSAVAPRARPLRFIVGLLLLSLSFASGAAAQTTGSATLRVNVKDPRSASVPQATVTVISERTGEQRQAPTSDEGNATFASLTPGAYTVKVEGPGFKTFEQKTLMLSPSDTRGFDVTLDVGSPSETVTVVGAAQELQTETGARETTITSAQIQNLSIVGRSALELLRTQPGVAAPNPDDPGFQSVGFNAGANANNQYNVNGLRGENNNVSIDGSRVIDIGSNNGSIITANNDMVSEVKVQSSNFAAEHSSSGIQITATTKGGGQAFHGTLYDYVRHNKLNANDRSRSLFGIERPKDKYQYPGGNIGGPVLLPFTKFNRERDRLFFFFGYEVQRQTVDPGTSFARVPTAAERTGNFGSLNVSDRIDPVGKALINLYPLPNFANPTGAHNNANYSFTGLQPINRTQASLRTDLKISNSTNMYVRLAREAEQQDYARGLWWNSSAYELPSHVKGKNLGRSAAVNLTSVINPTMTNEVVFSASKLLLDNDYADPSKVTLSALGINNLTNVFGKQSPYAPVALITSWGDSTTGDFWEAGGLPLFAHNSSYSVTDNLTKITGAHSLKFGGLIEQANKIQNQQGDPEGRFVYAPWGSGSTGNVFADVLVGRPAQVIQSTKVPVGKFRFYNIEGYAQDSWKVRPNLTVEYGMRLAFFPRNYERQGLGVLFDRSAYNPSQGLLINGDKTKPNGFLLASRGEVPKGILPNPRPQFAPRLNVAWDISGKGDTVIRGGVGLFYNRVQGNYQYSQLQQPPNVYSAQFDAGGFRGLNNNQGLTYSTLGLINPFTQLGSIGISSESRESNVIPRIASMSMSVARRLPGKNVLEVAYVGTLGRHLPDRRDINVVPMGRLLSGTVGNANLGQAQTIGGDTYSAAVQRAAVAGQANVLAQFRPFPAYSSVIIEEYNATSAYHSLQATLSRQYGRHLTYFATYTFSKALGISGTNETGDLIDPLDARHRSYGILPYDRTHIFNLSYNYDLPKFARGALENGFTRAALNGWQLSGITTIQSGNPIRLRFGGDIAGAGASLGTFGSDAFSNSNGSSGAIAPVLLRNPSTGGSGFDTRILDLSAIAIPAFGSSGATISPFYIRAPARSNFDMTLSKNFNFTESKRLQLRGGFFNIFNQAFPRFEQNNSIFSDINTTLNTVCNVRKNGVPNGTGGTSDNVCDPSGGYRFDQNTLNNFGRVTGKHGHRVVELALKFYF